VVSIVALTLIALSTHFSATAFTSCNFPEPEQLRIGNLALPSSQQPGTLFGFGQYIVDEGDFLGACAPIFQLGHDNNFSYVVPYLTYGIQDDMVVIFSLPVAAEFRDGCHTSSGLLDAYLEFEYAMYSYVTEVSSWEFSLVGAFTLPFGNWRKQPSTGFGSPAFFAGTIARYLSTEWYWYLALGGFFTTSHNNSRGGNTYLYQTGFGKNIGYESDKWICTLIFELNGNFSEKHKFCGILDQNTGGTQIALGPSIFFSTQKFIFQAGILPVVYQKWNGRQRKATMLIDLNFQWKI
jgi:hypothetical protein